MPILTRLVNQVLSKRLSAIDFFRKNPHMVQQRQFEYLVRTLSHTLYGKQYNVGREMTFLEFQKRLPVVTYDELSPFIERGRRGEPGVLWDTPVRWFAKSSGTTADKSKFIPVTSTYLHHCHFRGPKDVLALFTRNYPKSDIFSGKTLTLGGSHRLDMQEGSGAHSGDLSAIMIQNTPWYASFNRAPSLKVALTADFETKVRMICEETTRQNITSFAGVPSWNMVLLNEILKYTGKDNICEVWKNMELFIHGGVSFVPYREQYKRLIPSPDMKYMETYNASEGFFSIQDIPERDDMLLMLDYEIFYEFLPMEYLECPEKAVPLEDVQCGVNYAVIISSSAGLWRYMIGDTVIFTSTDPYRIKITGRTKHYINAFGEEVIVDNADRAIHEACRQTGAVIRDYTVAPVYMNEDAKGAHQWIIEFEKKPDNAERFNTVLDKTLQNVNSDYEAKRTRNTTLYPPQIIYAPQGLFYEWMKERGKLGGQNKIPRLANNRKYVDELLCIIERLGSDKQALKN